MSYLYFMERLDFKPNFPYNISNETASIYGVILV